MKKERKWAKQSAKLGMLMLIMIGLVANPLSVSLAQTNSAKVSKSSDTPATKPSPTPDIHAGLRRAAAEAIEELKAARKLLKKQGVLIAKQDQLLELERKISAKLKEINSLNERQVTEFWKLINAKDREITALENQNRILKKTRCGVICKFKIAVVAAGAGIVIGKVF